MTSNLKFDEFTIKVAATIVLWLLIGIFNFFTTLPSHPLNGVFELLVVITHAAWWIGFFVGIIVLIVGGVVYFDEYSGQIADWVNKKLKLGEYKDEI